MQLCYGRVLVLHSLLLLDREVAFLVHSKAVDSLELPFELYEASGGELLLLAHSQVGFEEAVSQGGNRFDEAHGDVVPTVRLDEGQRIVDLLLVRIWDLAQVRQPIVTRVVFAEGIFLVDRLVVSIEDTVADLKRALRPWCEGGSFLELIGHL